MAETLDLFADTLTEIANGPHVGSFGAVTEALMRRLSEKGLPLAHLADQKMMNRSIRTLEARAREYGLAFPDYVPLSLRKRLVFQQRGDFYVLRGEDAVAVAKCLDTVVTGKGDAREVSFPVHAADECRQVLETAWYVVKLIRAKKPRKVVANG